MSCLYTRTCLAYAGSTQNYKGQLKLGGRCSHYHTDCFRFPGTFFSLVPNFGWVDLREEIFLFFFQFQLPAILNPRPLGRRKARVLAIKLPRLLRLRGFKLHSPVTTDNQQHDLCIGRWIVSTHKKTVHRLTWYNFNAITWHKKKCCMTWGTL